MLELMRRMKPLEFWFRFSGTAEMFGTTKSIKLELGLICLPYPYIYIEYLGSVILSILTLGRMSHWTLIEPALGDANKSRFTTFIYKRDLDGGPFNGSGVWLYVALTKA